MALLITYFQLKEYSIFYLNEGLHTWLPWDIHMSESGSGLLCHVMFAIQNQCIFALLHLHSKHFL